MSETIECDAAVFPHRSGRALTRMFFYHDSLPYFVDSGPPLGLDDSVTIYGVPFRVFRIREVPERQEQRLWVE